VEWREGEGDEVVDPRPSGSGHGMDQMRTDQSWIDEENTSTARIERHIPPSPGTHSPGRPRWESGKGRCAVTGRRVLGGTDGLRRLMI
jgi:hypothetical protein